MNTPSSSTDAMIHQPTESAAADDAQSDHASRPINASGPITLTRANYGPRQ